MKNFKLTIQYDGSRYKGWQKLGDTDNTIQSRIEKVLSRMTGEETELIGSGRTDAGVHAFKQVANFHTSAGVNCSDILSYCYEYLPEDIVITEAEEVDKLFHSRYNAKRKKYMYRIWNGKFHNPFMRKYTYHIAKKLDINLMNKASAHLIGEKDFSSFTSLKAKKKSMVREIYSIDISCDNRFVDIIYYGNGFLYNMARIITGTLIETGLGRMEPDYVKKVLEKRDRTLAGPKVPSHGLVLLDVEY
ncbi:MAG: tRNA pseudouridine(38-40) synthase TruA [Clostridiaceae bacterium]|nr:tRNA pseudouridine(38-40) synthase TruA [Clostridiaceae bacterium]